jgi:hypothetical protein
MHPLVTSQLAAIKSVCARFRVRRLAVFGSCAAPRPGSEPGDIDLLVEFEPMTPSEHADSYFGLLEQFESLFQVPVDLVEPAAIRNAIFQQAVDLTQVPVYVAA